MAAGGVLLACWRLEVTTRYRAPIEDVWAYKTDLSALSEEFSPYVRLWIDDAEALQAALRGAGGLTMPGHLSGPIGLLKMPWTFEIREVDAPRLFRDTSRNAFYARWEHRHRFEQEGEGVVAYVDDLTFVPRLRPSVLAARMTRALVGYRHRVAAGHLPAIPGTVGTSRLWRER